MNTVLSWKCLLGCSALTLAVGGLSAFLTHDSMKLYQTLQKPPFSPPAIVFPIVWTILYLLMAVSFCMVMQQCSRSHSSLQTPAWLYGTQLVCNGLWPILFFSLGYRLFSLLWLLLLLALVSRMILVFARIQKKAALLQLPYLLWLCFAAYLNLGVWMRNKTA